MYTTRFTVEGGGQFPLDMLRYDGCYPASQDDVARMGFEGRVVDQSVGPGRRRVTLITSHPTKGQNGLTNDRWKSFGWQIVEVAKPV